MKILVCMSQVPDTTTKVSFTDNNTKFNSAGVQYIINPYDELALTKAIEITEKSGGTVTVIHVGPVDTEANIRKALAIGAHDAIRINASPEDALYVAEQIAWAVKDQNYDLIMCGRESIDYNSGLVGGLLAELLGWPLINVVAKMEVEGGSIMADRDIDGGKETLKASLPCVVTAQKDLTEPRIPNMRGIMAARTKPLQVLEPAAVSPLVQVVSYELPQPKGACKFIDAENAGQLIELLHQEVKVI